MNLMGTLCLNKKIFFTFLFYIRNLLTSHFEPIDARKGFPCMDEPSFKSVFQIKLDHPTGTVALSNMPVNVRYFLLS